MSATRVCPVCRYTHDYLNDVVADAQHARHSCARHLRIAHAAQRRADRAATGPTRDCTHRGHPHKHGTRVAYVRDRCRCPRCTTANTTEWRAGVRDQTYGAPRRYVDAAPARAHIDVLRRAGIGANQIAKHARTSSSHIREIAQITSRTGNRPPIAHIGRNLARRILAIQPTAAYQSPHSRVAATGTRRRLHALVAIGWQPAQLASHLGRTTKNLRRTMTGATVHVRTAQDVSQLYDRLWDIPPPDTTQAQRKAADAACAHAAEHGWLPPLAWDDIDTDPTTPDAKPDPDDIDEIAVERAVAGDRIRLDELTPPSRPRRSAVSPSAANQSATSPTSSPPPNAPSPDAAKPPRAPRNHSAGSGLGGLGTVRIAVFPA